jgi:hypothetical protein
MATDNTALPAYLQEASRLARYPFALYHPDQKLRVCVTGAGGHRPPSLRGSRRKATA